MFGRFSSNETKTRKLTIENKVLYLIQLWADTFMMHEDKYPYFLSTYRDLRKEGVNFPSREVAARFMLSGMKIDSPMFDYLDEIRNSSSLDKKTTTISKRVMLKEDQEKLDAEKKFKHFVGGNVGVVSHEKNAKNLAKVTLSQADIETIKSYMEIIDELCVNTDTLKEFKSDIGLEMYRYCQAVNTRCLNIVAAKSAHGIEHQVDVLLSLSENLDVRMKLYKNTFIDLLLKEKYGKGTTTINKKETIKDKKVESDESDESDEEEKKTTEKKHKGNIKTIPPPPSNQFFQFDTKQEALVDLLDDFNEQKRNKIEEVKNENKPEMPMNNLLDLNIELEPESKSKPEDKKVDDDFFESLANRE